MCFRFSLKTLMPFIQCGLTREKCSYGVLWRGQVSHINMQQLWRIILIFEEKCVPLASAPGPFPGWLLCLAHTYYDAIFCGKKQSLLPQLLESDNELLPI